MQTRGFAFDGSDSQRERLLFAGSFSLCGGIFLFVLLLWFAHDPTAHFREHVPGMDGEPPGISSGTPALGEGVRIGEFFESFARITAAAGSGRWPRFRGSNYDNISTERIRLRRTWNTPPPVLWTREVGEGHAAPAVFDGLIYLLDYDESREADALRCLSLEDGSELWRRWYTVKIKRNHGMSRTIPAVTDSFVVTMGPRCHVMCVRRTTGELLWGLDLEREFGAEVPLWYTGQCPLIDDTTAVIAPGGRALMIGVDCRSGEILWETPNPRGWKMSHSSIVPMSVGSRRVYLYCAVGGIVGVAADGPERGSVLFESDAFNHSVVATSPVVLEEGRIFMTAGYGAGSALLQVRETQGKFTVEVIGTFDVRNGPASEQQTPIYYQGHLFSVLPKDAGPLRGQFVCVHPDDCTKILWSSGPDRRFGLGPFLVADGKFFILDDHANLTVAQATARGYEELGRMEIIDGVDAWGPMALTHGRLLIRDSKRMVCLDVRE